ncbi:membrane protein required for colicin V production [Chitinophaga dinghuensis]|uniref:Membrane protein required for colicin V production n=1 Tax=Chitinophaga dinghuensis TaxID=1539050 RepID=A0A327W945_9BACT|nr:CvpA family protein [Chitinophaga dinghuensis]RAJ85762.1 membrane protein required for colicin V production [Chitinophaga dinghuensis]
MPIDVVFAVLMVFAVYKGYTRGLIVAVFSVIGLVLGMAAALKLSSATALYVQRHWNVHFMWLPVLCYICLFTVVVLLVRLGATALQRVVEMVLLGWLNKLGGILLYSLVFIIIYSVLLWIANQLYWLSPETKLQSVVYPYIEKVGPWVLNNIGKVLPIFKDIFTQLQAFFDGAARHIPSS